MTKANEFVSLFKGEMKVVRYISHNQTAVDIFMLVLEHMDAHNSVITSVNMLTKLTGKSTSSVYRALKLLQDRNILYPTNMGGCVLFTCNANLAWSSYHNTRGRYAKMHAKVLVDDSEIPEQFKKLSIHRGEIVDTHTGEL